MKLKVPIKMEAGCGDMSDPIISGLLVKLTPEEAVIIWNQQAWYTTGHIGLEFGPNRRVYTRKEFDRLMSNEADYDRIRIAPKPRKIKRCKTCGHEL